jgi:hypothetical protein
MPLIRGHHKFDDKFVQIPNDWLRDSRLSLKARGLLAQIMTHREDWSLSINKLAQDNGEGKHAIRGAIAELERYGYLVRDQINDGRFSESVWTTQDPPVESDLPLSDNPLSEIPLSENQTTKKNIIKEEHLKEKQLKNTNEFEEFWSHYPRKVDRAKAERAFRAALKRASFDEILFGVIAYRDDPKRDPDYTKYPATWLNSDSWQNATAQPDNEAAQRAARRRDKELEQSAALLAEIKEREKLSAPPPQCDHGINLALCRKCAK